MKYIAGISISISFLVFAFIAYGYFSPAIDHTAKEEVNAPLDKCWGFFKKVHRMDEWISGFKKIEIIEGFPNRPGSKFRVILEKDGEEISLVQTVIAYEEGKVFSFNMENDQVFGHTEISFEHEDGKTYIDYRQILKGTNALYNAVINIQEGQFVDQQNKDLHKLRLLIESSD